MLVCRAVDVRATSEDDAMRIRVLAAILLLGGAAFARAEDAPAPQPAASGVAASPQTQTTESKQSLDHAPADSQVGKTTEPAGRFSLRRVDGGFLRFDSHTGQVAYCNSQRGGWSCEAVPESRAALEKEVEQLRAEIAALQDKLKAQQEEPPRPPRPIPPPQAIPPAGPPPASGKGGDMTLLPGGEQISRATAAMQDAWHHFVELVIGLKNDLLRRS
jgi:hypothetical protein